MTRTEIFDRLRTVAEDPADPDVDWELVTEETTFGELGLEPASVMGLISDIQQVVGVDFDMEDLPTLNTVGELVEFIEEELKA